MKPALLIRAAEKSDIPAIAALLDTLNQIEGYAVATDENALSIALFGQAQEVKLAALVAETQQQVVGLALYYSGYDTVSASYGYHLADMVVADAQRQSGIGRALMKSLAGQALTQKKEWISLTVLNRNMAAQKFYQSLGMTHVDVNFFAMGKTALAQL